MSVRGVLDRLRNLFGIREGSFNTSNAVGQCRTEKVKGTMIAKEGHRQDASL